MRDIQFITLESAARIGHVSEGQARRWARDGILIPSVLYGRNAQRHSFIYSPDDVVALRVISELQHQFNMPLQSASVAGKSIQKRQNRPWSDVRFLISGKQIHMIDLNNSQAPVDDEVILDIAPFAEAVAEDLKRLAQRNPENIGKIERNRNVLGGQPVVKGTRVPVSTIVNLDAAGWDIDRILKSYPSLVPDDIRGVLQLVEEQRQVA